LAYTDTAATAGGESILTTRFQPMGAQAEPGGAQADAQATLVAGELVRYSAAIWEVRRVWNTNTEGFRANLERATDDGIPVRCIAAVGDCQRIA
jgi:hypothetical protein